MSTQAPLRLALVWRGDPRAPDRPNRYHTRLQPLIAALGAAGVMVDPVAYFDETVEAARERLLACDGAMVWVNPLADGQDRSHLDPMLREVAAAGVWVSAHPDVIQAMGTKEVLVRTRDLGWGADTHLYETFDAFGQEFPSRLAAGKARVLKRNRGNDGQDVWKIEATGAGASGLPHVIVQAAATDQIEYLPLPALLERCRPLFEGAGPVIDQAFQPRVGEGMIRCYMSGDRVAGFGEQFPRIPQGAEVPPLGMNSAKIMHAATEPRFAGLRGMMEADWLPEMMRLLSLTSIHLPAVWDADFLLGPRDAAGADTYVLCEINVSSVLPFPDTAADAIAALVVARLAAARGLAAAGEVT